MRTFVFIDSANGVNGFQFFASAVNPPEIHSDMNPPAIVDYVPGDDFFTNMQCQNLYSNKHGLIDKGVGKLSETPSSPAKGDYYTAEEDGDYVNFAPPTGGLLGVKKGDILLFDGTNWVVGGYKTDFSDIFPPQVATPKDPISGADQDTGMKWLMNFAYKNRFDAKEVAVPTFEIAIGEKDEEPAPAQDVDLPFIADLAMAAHDLAFVLGTASKDSVVFTGGAPPFMFTLDDTTPLPAGFTFDVETGEFIYDGTGAASDTAVNVAIDDGVTNANAAVTLKVAAAPLVPAP
jgi:hypothetical protein